MWKDCHAGTCRHVSPLKAVNLVGTGERYAYAMFLLVHHFYAMAPKFIFQDIACKHQAWRARVQQRISELSAEARQAQPAYQAVMVAMAHALLTTDVLPEMHGCLHAWPCQVGHVIVRQTFKVCFNAGRARCM